MCNNKTLLAVAAVAVMLLSATSAQAYDEWCGAGSGTGVIYYNMYPYYYHHGDYGGTVHCETSGDYDYFDENTISWCAVFYRYYNNDPDAAILDTLVMEEASGNYFDGQKETGTSGIKDGWGTFDAIISNKSNYPVVGAWYANDYEEGYYFTYNTTPPSMNGRWTISSTPFNGYGTFNMERTYYSP